MVFSPLQITSVPWTEVIFTDDLQSDQLSSLRNWHHQSPVYSDPRPRRDPISPLSPISRPRTSPGNFISPNYLKSERFSLSSLLPLGSHHSPLHSGPQQPPLPGLAQSGSRSILRMYLKLTFGIKSQLTCTRLLCCGHSGLPPGLQTHLRMLALLPPDQVGTLTLTREPSLSHHVGFCLQ